MTDLTKWQKFVYSLMLHPGMRLTKVDAATAWTWVTEALASGVSTDEADTAKVSYLATGPLINQNPVAYNQLISDYITANGTANREGGKYQQVFSDYPK